MWPPCPLPLDCGLIHVTGRANWGFSHVAGGEEVVRAIRRRVEINGLESSQGSVYPQREKTNCLLDNMNNSLKPEEFYQTCRKDSG